MVDRPGFVELGAPGVCQGGVTSPPVSGTRPALDPAFPFEPVDCVGDPASREDGEVGELTHPKTLFTGFLKPREQAVIGEGDPDFLCEGFVQLIEEKPRSHDEAAPCGELLARQLRDL